MSEDAKRTLGGYLRAAREQAGMSQRQLARLVGVDNAYIFRLENGTKTDPSASLLQRIADALNVDNSELMAFIGVQPSLPEPRLYFRRKLGVDADEAEVLARLIEEHQAQAKERRGGHHEENNQG